MIQADWEHYVSLQEQWQKFISWISMFMALQLFKDLNKILPHQWEILLFAKEGNTFANQI